MKFIFWNSKSHSTFSTILEILDRECPDILFLAETDVSLISSNLKELNSKDYDHFENPGCPRIIIIKNVNLNISLSIQNAYYSALKDNSDDVTIISVHLPSQMYQHVDGLKNFIRNFRNEIDEEFGSSLDRSILVIGDFNINPFEKPMIDFDGFSASNSKRLRKEAVHLKSKKALYYNPTWMLYQKNAFPGTKYYRRPSQSSFDILEHHFLDQVVLSYCMSQRITFESINVLEKTASNIFFDSVANKINLSDHLPLIYEYKLNRI